MISHRIETTSKHCTLTQFPAKMTLSRLRRRIVLGEPGIGAEPGITVAVVVVLSVFVILRHPRYEMRR